MIGFKINFDDMALRHPSFKQVLLEKLEKEKTLSAPTYAGENLYQMMMLCLDKAVEQQFSLDCHADPFCRVNVWTELKVITAYHISSEAASKFFKAHNMLTNLKVSLSSYWKIPFTDERHAVTAASPAYAGPFALSQSATVKALAVHDETGWATDVAEQRFDLAPPFTLTSLRERQRYPWNGLVDIDFALAGGRRQ